MSKMTAQEIIEQAHCTADLLEINTETDEGLDALWNFAFTTWAVAGEDGEERCTIEELEEHFNEPRGCPTGEQS